MAELARGQVSDRPFARTVYTIGARRFTGDFLIGDGERSVRLGWSEGRVVDAAVDGDEALAAADALERSLAAFALPDAVFMLDDEPSLPGDPELVEVGGIDVRFLIYRGLSAHYDQYRLVAETAVLADHAFKLADDAVPGLPAFGFSEDDRTWLTLLGQRFWRMPDLLDASGEDSARAVLAVVYALLATDGLDIDKEAAEPAPAPAAPAPRPRPDDGLRRTVAGDDLSLLLDKKLAAMEAGADHYAILGLEPGASKEAIRTAYFDLAKQLHPDRLSALSLDEYQAPAQKLFARLNDAFGVLGNDGKRSEYFSQLVGETPAEEPMDAATEEQVAKVFEAEEWFRKGEMALRRSHHAHALECFTRALELNPDEPEHHALFAWATWCAAADKPAVIKQVKLELQQAITMSQLCLPAYFYRGQLAKAQGDEETAEQCFLKVLELREGHVEAELELRLLATRKDNKKRPSPSKAKAGKVGSLLDKLKRR